MQPIVYSVVQDFARDDSLKNELRSAAKVPNFGLRSWRA